MLRTANLGSRWSQARHTSRYLVLFGLFVFPICLFFHKLLFLCIYFLFELTYISGERYEDSIFAKIPLYSAQYNFTRMYTEFIVGNRKNLLQYTDVATDIVPRSFVGMYKVDFDVWVAEICCILMYTNFIGI